MTDYDKAEKNETMMYPTSIETKVTTIPFEQRYNSSTSSKGSNNRKRQRLHIAAGPHQYEYSSPTSNQQHEENTLDDPPDWKHYSILLSGLLLTTGLSLLSAWDAEQHCLQHETYALLDLVDDDNFQKAYDNAVLNEGDKCIRMFEYVLLPTGCGTAVVGSLALYSIIKHVRFFQHRPTSPSAQCNIQLLSRTLSFTCVLVALHLYALASIMLSVRHTVSDNPYQSLAAVDQYGHVGDNANLYYTTWMSVGLSLALLYQLSTTTVRWWRTARLQATQSVLLPATSWHTGINIKEDQRMWYKSLYQLRVRSGIWTAALFSCIVLIVSSLYVWHSILWPYAVNYTYNVENQDGVEDANTVSFSFSKKLTFNAYTRVCKAAQQEGLEPQLCRRTATAWVFGVLAAILCSTAIGMHLWARWSATQRELLDATYGAWDTLSPTLQFDSGAPLWERLLVQERLPLRTELALSIVLSIMLGLNAVWSTGVQGPAASVGNLYYASWCSFLLCVRICLGCLEEYYNLDDKEMNNPVKDQTTLKADLYTAPTLDAPVTSTNANHDIQKDIVKTESQSSERTFHDPLEKDRLKRLRSYFFQFIFSIVCAASAYDAASNQKGKLTRAQKYMIWAPLAVSLLSLLLFALCLSRQCYMFVSHFCIGGILSIFAFLTWLADLFLTMHLEGSWAVDSIGEIKTANLYYFSWASIITAGLLMMSYLKTFLGIEKNDFISVVCAGVCKICFVILGASLHIWHTIAGNCDFDEITSGAVTFCSRTILAMIVALTGMVVGGLVISLRMLLTLCPSCRCSRLQAHAEMVVSIFLVFLFGAAVAMITGIGGPGQSVGDLYYSTWLAFWVSLWMFVVCYEQIKFEDTQIDQQKIQVSIHKVESAVFV